MVAGVGADSGGGVTKEHIRDDGSDEVSSGGVEGAEEEDETVSEVDVKHHEFLVPFLFFWVGSFKLPDLLAALIAA